MKKFIYQDPRRPRFKSRPIDESDAKARQILEGSGWRVVETIDDGVEAPAVSVETEVAAEAPKARARRAAEAPKPSEA
jgi:hypothetical protein